MAKIRVHELAKELGLENKEVLSLCAELEIAGKKSHSNSLTDGESDKIRRHVIRSAVSEKGESVREVTRSGSLVTERRVGGGTGVIRRRKKADAPATEAAPVEDEVEASASDDQPSSNPLQAAEALFSETKDESEAAEAVAEPEVEEAPAAVEEEVAPVAAVVAESAPEVAVSVEEPVVEEAKTDEVEAVTDSTEEKKDTKIADIRKRHDVRAPRILGKIELPAAEGGKRGASPERNSGRDAPDNSRGKPKRKGSAAPSTPDRRDTGNKREKGSRRRQVLRKDELLDYGERDNWKGKKDRRGRRSSSPTQPTQPVKQGTRTVKIDGEISVGEFSKQMGVKAGEVVRHLMGLGTMVTINQLIDFDTATVVAEEFGAKTVNTQSDVEEMMASFREEDEGDEAAVLRPPVVTVMGHVDHGKTSLLDTIRQTAVTGDEFGGITQHIGAYNVPLSSGGSVTFLDTPGHEAFTAMRMRGAQLTDIVVLVVAADDGVMPQTIEAISHSKAAGVPIIVAVNKMDKEGANPERVINQLSEHGLVPEEWGGDTIICKVSAHTKEGLDALLENLHLQAEILELKADPARAAYGTVIESRLDKGRGNVVTVLVEGGTLRKGDIFVAGAISGRVKAMIADNGDTLEEAGPSIPVEILGASNSAVAGDDFAVVGDESQARAISEERSQKLRRRALTLEQFSEMVGESADLKELPLIVKADVQGSVEAVKEALLQLSNEEVRVNVIHRAVGGVTENDVQLASASKAIIIAFNVRPDVRAMHAMESEGV
ncbi:UNVERIFIED_CONTAM: hypothetical protein GTU68_017644, partial [Idotea baltica]|nr:hypothetical protein [Idotea baltica]